MSKTVFGHFIENAALVLAEISYLDSSYHYLQLHLQKSLKNHLHPFSSILGQFLAKLCDFQIALCCDRPIFTVRFKCSLFP